jgi:hypothetical protein
MPNALQTTQAGQGPAGQTSITAAIPATSTTITFTQPSNTVMLTNQSASTILYYNLGTTTATTSNASLGGSINQQLVYKGPPLTAITILGSTASGNYSLLAY